MLASGFSNRKAGRGGGGVGDDGCRKCGQIGHFARECPTNLGNRNNPSTDNIIGFGRAEPNGLSPSVFPPAPVNAEASNQRPPITYIPAETALDQLWGRRIDPGSNFNHFFEIRPEITGDDATCPPITSFEDAGLTPLVAANVKKCGYNKPTPIQQHAMPYIMKGRDLMGCAQTGSGKTAAFLLPILTSLLKRGDASGTFAHRQEPSAIILTPTRELAMQIKDEARKFACGTMVAVAILYGGTNVRGQYTDLQRGCNILVATPGRLMQFIEEAKITLSRCRYLVLDEADRMLDMGFEPTIRRLMELPEMPPKGDQRQTLMFSATFPTEIQRLAQDFLQHYVFVTIGIVGSANDDIVQEILRVPQSEKYEKLYQLVTDDLQRAVALGSDKITKTLVFVERKRVADFVASRLSQMGVTTTSIHGDREQRERETALWDFKSGTCPILVATAVASRGLDIAGVDHVINFDLPQNRDDYVHRIGRTGRVGNIGRATSFFDFNNDTAMIHPLVQVMRESQQTVPDWLLEALAANPAPNTGGDNGAGNVVDEDVW